MPPPRSSSQGRPNPRVVVGLSVGIALGFVLAVGSNYRTVLREAAECEGRLRGSAADPPQRCPQQVACPTCPSEIQRECVPSDGVDGQPRNELQSALKSQLQNLAPQKEVLLAISNYDMLHEWRGNDKGMLQYWLKGVQNSGVKNYIVCALDQKLADWLEARGVPHYFKDLKPTQDQMSTGSNHAISGLKFQIIEDFLQIGWSVLLSDVDVIVLKDPFDHLHRDADVEGMSDGFDDRSAYGSIEGFDDASMGWARYAQTVRHFVFNSGLFYIRANERTMELMRRVAGRLARERAWDQSVFNEEIFFLPHGGKKGIYIRPRVLDIYTFVNSKVFFKKLKGQWSSRKPAMVHVNYHPDKFERMEAIYLYYWEGKTNVLDPFPGGSEPGS